MKINNLIVCDKCEICYVPVFQETPLSLHMAGIKILGSPGREGAYTEWYLPPSEWFCIRVGSKTTKTCKCWTCCTGMPLFCQASENENPPALKIISILLTQDLFPRMFYEQEIPFYTRPCVYSFCHFLFFLNGDNCTTGDTSDFSRDENVSWIQRNHPCWWEIYNSLMD